MFWLRPELSRLPSTLPRAVKGHEFGLDLSADEHTALIAFLRML